MSTITSQHEAAINSAASALARVQLKSQAAEKAHADATEKANVVRERLASVREQIVGIRRDAEGGSLTDAQAGRVHLLVLDETDLVGHLTAAEGVVTEARAVLEVARGNETLAANSLLQTKRHVRAVALHDRVLQLEELLCKTLDEAFAEHVAAGGSSNFPSFWTAGDGLRKAVMWARAPGVSVQR